MIQTSFINHIDFWDRISDFSVEEHDNYVIYHITLDGLDYSVGYDGERLIMKGGSQKNPVQTGKHIRHFFDIANDMNVECEYVGNFN